jgi:Cu2+-exporting ATPase
MTMDVPISLGILLALGMSLYETIHSAEHAYFDSAVMLLFFLLLGRVLDQVMRKKTRSVADNLMALKGDTAVVLDPSGEARQVPVRAVQINDLVLVRPGERIAVDGEVVSGQSSIDASLVTGETMQDRIGPGTHVYAGTLNIGGTLQVRVTAAHEGTLLDEVNRLVAQAADARSNYLRLADRAARIYSPIVHLAALSTCLGWILVGASLHDAIITAIAVLIITCPCALALAVPATQVVASGALFKAGLLLQAPDGIERAAQCDTVVFDKTGTLTLPEPRIANRDAVDPALLEAAARLALSSRHPLAMALSAEVQRRVPLSNVEEITGEGIRASVDGVEYRLGSPAFCDAESMAAQALGAQRDASVIAFRRGDEKAVFLLRQALRPDAIETVGTLRAKNYALAILSGDNEAAVAQVARALGITDWKSALKPADKIAALDALKRDGRRVLMVGDGLNDAPALAAAHASLSPVSAAHVAQASADALFIGDALAPVPAMLGLSRKAVRVMKDNLWIAVIYNLIAVPLAVLGHVTPLIAAAAMSGSSIIVTLSALRASRPMQSPLPARPAATCAPRNEARLAS